MKNAIEYLKGKKTYIVSVCAIIYGLYTKDAQAILLGLGLVGLRNGLTTEAAKIITKKK